MLPQIVAQMNDHVEMNTEQNDLKIVHLTVVKTRTKLQREEATDLLAMHEEVAVDQTRHTLLRAEAIREVLALGALVVREAQVVRAEALLADQEEARDSTQR